MKVTDILCEDTFKKYYSEKIFNNILEFILEAFYTEDYRGSEDIDILYHDKTSIGSPQNPQHDLFVNFAYNGNVFHIDISDGISNGTEIKGGFY